MSSELPRKRATHKGDATRVAIKSAARRVIASVGFANAKIADIMDGADRSPGAFYVYYKSKEALLHELLGEFRLRLKEEVNKPLAAQENPLQNLFTRLDAFWKIYREDWSIATGGFQMAMSDSDFARTWRGIRQQGIRGLSTLIVAAQKEGYCPGLDPELTASALCSMIEYTCYNWTSKNGDFPDRHIDDEQAALTLRQLVAHAIGWRDAPNEITSRRQQDAVLPGS